MKKTYYAECLFNIAELNVGIDNVATLTSDTSYFSDRFGYVVGHYEGDIRVSHFKEDKENGNLNNLEQVMINHYYKELPRRIKKADGSTKMISLIYVPFKVLDHPCTKAPAPYDVDEPCEFELCFDDGENRRFLFIPEDTNFKWPFTICDVLDNFDDLIEDLAHTKDTGVTIVDGVNISVEFFDPTGFVVDKEYKNAGEMKNDLVSIRRVIADPIGNSDEFIDNDFEE